MSTNQIRFDDGEAYERYMGKWSQLAGNAFLNWLVPQPGLRWLDVGCGNGAFTELLAEQCTPISLHGVDPAEGQLNFARARPVFQIAQFVHGDAMALPFQDDMFDMAVMPLVIFFVPEPSKGVAEMVRVVRPGGAVTAYAWDMPGGGFPYEALFAEMRSLGIDVPVPPSADASRIDILQDLWIKANLLEVETMEISVQRTFVDFEDYWMTILGAPSVGHKLKAMEPEEIGLLRGRLSTRLQKDGQVPITYSARANAVKGLVSK